MAERSAGALAAWQLAYRHFPDERDLLAACSAHWLGADPPPDVSAWTDLRPALEELHAWYRRDADMLANTARDAPSMPILAEIADPGPFLEAARGVLGSALAARHGLDMDPESIGVLCEREGLRPPGA